MFVGLVAFLSVSSLLLAALLSWMAYSAAQGSRILDQRSPLAAFGMVLLAALVIIAISFGGLLPILWGYLRQKRLVQWGRTAPATIIEEREIRRNGRPLLRIAYRFSDDTGKFVAGVRTGLPSPLPAAVAANPTVLYDPSDSSRNTFYYSASFVRCLRRDGEPISGR